MLFCNTKICVMYNRSGLSDLYRSDTEVPSYGFWSSLVDMGSKAASSLGNLVTKGASSLGNLVSKVPVVGDTIGSVVSTAGKGLGNIVSGQFGSGLGNLYSAADTALGGFLPNMGVSGTIAPSGGWMASLYNAGDKALGGYLPNIGGGFGTVSPAGGGLGSLFGGSDAAAKGAKMSTWDKIGTAADLLQAGAGIYGAIKGQPGNAGQYQQAAGGQVEPVILGTQGTGGVASVPGGNMGGLVAADPAMAGVVGGGSVPLIADAMAGASISDQDVKQDNDNLAEALREISKNRTQVVAEKGLGIEYA